MNKFNLSIVLILAVTAFAIYKSTSQEETYKSRISNIAKQINSMNTTWRAEEPSRFANMDRASIKGLMGALFEATPSLKEVSEFHSFPNPAPDSFDSRTQWSKCQSISEIRDQANCGSCWAFGAAEAMSDRVCIASDQTIQTRISTQDIMTCCTSCGQGCNGGYLGPTWSYFQNTGVVTGDLYNDKTTCQPYSLPPCAHHTTSTKYPACPPVVPTPNC